MYTIDNYYSLCLGYDIGCVSKRRYDQTLSIQSGLEDGIKLLSSVSQSMYKWKNLLGLKPSKNPTIKTLVDSIFYIISMFILCIKI